MFKIGNNKGIKNNDDKADKMVIDLSKSKS